MSVRGELDAAGIDGAALRASYTLCRSMNAEHGKTYFLATLLLPPAKRPFVHALYGFCRYADDIVDDLGPATAAARRDAAEDRRPRGARRGELGRLRHRPRSRDPRRNGPTGSPGGARTSSPISTGAPRATR